MHLYRMILPVTDIESATRFYAAVFEACGRRISGGRHYFSPSANEGGAILALYSPAEDGDAARFGVEWRQHPLQYVYFSVSDLEAARTRCIAMGAKEVTEIASMPWGETMFYALDPFGNPISFVAAGTEFTAED